MKKTMLISGLLGIMLIFGNVLAQGQTLSTKTPRITKKQVSQQARIKQGVKSGELTKKETAKLQMQQAKIKNDKQAAKSDGKVTSAERNEIRKEQRKASRHIYRAKHNEKTK
jgi:hypothetical protein